MLLRKRICSLNPMILTGFYGPQPVGTSIWLCRLSLDEESYSLTTPSVPGSSEECAGGRKIDHPHIS